MTLSKLLGSYSSSLSAAAYASSTATQYITFDPCIQKIGITAKIGDMTEAGNLCVSLSHADESADEHATWKLLKGATAISTSSGSASAFENTQPPLAYGKLDVRFENVHSDANAVANIIVKIFGQGA
jgi:hypothetical protein